MLLKKRFNLICGHYGCGKTNLSLNLALEAAKSGQKVTLVDMDLVNPYFRSSDYATQLQQENIRIIAPVYANSNVDVPSLPADVYGIFDSDELVIMDVGGDDVGATVLGRFSAQINALDYDLFYVINKYRNLTAEPEEAVAVLQEIERVSRLKASGLISNAHLKAETTPKTILSSLDYAEKVSELTGLECKAVTVPKRIAAEFEKEAEANNVKVPVYPIDIIVKSTFEV